MTASEHKRYAAVAIVLHWAIALAIFAMIPLGWWMGDAIEDPARQAQAFAAFQLHKSIGLTILLLSLVRLAWRLTHPAPPLPPHMPQWERVTAIAVHWIFYALIIVMPLTGWLYVSLGWSAHDHHQLDVPTIYFGLFRVPHLFGLEGLGDSARDSLAGLVMGVHSKLAWGAIVLAALHVGAALKHHFFDQDDVLTHMVPGLKPLAGEAPEFPVSPTRHLILTGGFALIVVAAIAGFYAFASAGQSAAPRPAVPPPAVTEPATTEPEPTEAATATTEATTAAATTTTAAAAPPTWRVDQSKSYIHYAGEHVGTPFEGAFARWRANISFDPNNLAASRVIATIETGSAADGQPLHDSTLPEQEWFDVAHHPTARFESSRFRSATGAGAYTATGALVMKGKRLPVTLPFTLRIQGDRAIMDGQIDIDRTAADLGQQSDPGAEYVSQTIRVTVHVEATRAP